MDDGPGFFAAVVGCIALVIIVLLGSVVGIGATARYLSRHSRNQDRTQALYDAKNKVKVSSIEIKNQNQRVEVAKQQAEIRLQNAIGIREAQDQIAKTLTPLYVQFEMTQALLEIAKSGKNNSTVFIPSGAGGIPLVSSADPSQVTKP